MEGLGDDGSSGVGAGDGAVEDTFEDGKLGTVTVDFLADAVLGEDDGYSENA